MSDQTIIDKHKAFSAELRMLVKAQFFLISEIDHKRCRKVRTRFEFRPQFKYLDPYYSNILYMGRKKFTDREKVYPGVFKLNMATVLERQSPEYSHYDDKALRIYYTNPKDDTLFHESEWSLHVTDPSGDIPTIIRLRDMILDFMARAVDEAEGVLLKDSTALKLMKREFEHFKYISSLVPSTSSSSSYSS